MAEMVHVELRVSAATDSARIETDLRKTITGNKSGNEIRELDRAESIGMSGTDLIITIVVALGANTVTTVFQDEIRAAAKTLGELLNTDIRVFFGKDNASGK